ncbi:hypothetical protein CPAR01_12864 [Colletotrichum paranaense]|uniref:Fungal N-terminal domain-containing protein n=1 Tax=Colletotrichum paranaense TaxID=1914294 RepID=A0ABQ9S7M2_9PEZI|nr:uncharacterized protein CPAR01_12864 [Colletotrichum paranaense]KAK1528306.1 hypothetical protein CPAR01_12864 [Colletotrichum paranaense]
MAEAFGVVVSAFTVVEIAGKLGSSTIKLKKLWNEVQDVPREINQLVEQVDILNAILTEMDVELTSGERAGDTGDRLTTANSYREEVTEEHNKAQGYT